MKTAVPHLPLLGLAQTAAMIRGCMMKGWPDATPEEWKIFDREHQITMLQRSAVRFLMDDWYAWYLKGPEVTQADIEKSYAEVQGRADMFLFRKPAMASLESRGYGDLVQAYSNLRDRLMGSGEAYFREVEMDTDNLSDRDLCILLIHYGLKGKEGSPARPGVMMWGAVEPADLFIVTLAKIFTEIENKTGRKPNRMEYGVATRAISDFAMRASLMQKTPSMHTTMCHDNADRTIKCIWNGNTLTGVDFTVNEWTPTKTTADFIANSDVTPIHTGCPAAFSRAAGATPNNPVKAFFDWYARDCYKALFGASVATPALSSACAMRRIPT